MFDPQIDTSIQTALRPPFAFQDVFVYSHGWSTNADTALDNPGTWMFHCHFSDHMEAGMVARYQVTM